MNNTENKDQPFSGTPSKNEETDVPLFSGFEEAGEYEEPDRDTDYTSIYREDGIEDEEFADALFEEEGESDQETGELDLWAASVADELNEDGEDLLELMIENEQEDAEEQDTVLTFSEPLDPVEGDAPEHVLREHSDTEEDEWEEEWDEEWDEDETDDTQEPDAPEQQTWPLGLIAVAIVALLLVMAGGYGVVQQRSATQEELRRLQAELATSVSPGDIVQTREALEEARQRNFQLQTMMDALNLENRSLSDTVAGLEAQLEAQRNALVTEEPTPAPPVKEKAPVTAEPEAAPAPAVPASPKPQVAERPAEVEKIAPAAPKPSAPQAGIDNHWFVNFASYGVEATAREWVARLDPSAGKAVMVTGTRNGRTFYRVRVIDLPNRASADRVAEELAKKHRLSRLWVGQQQ